jgi:5'-3' exonuclease
MASCLQQMVNIRPTIRNLRKVCVILGSDFAPKTPGIGPKTIFKKFDSIVITDKQKAAIEQFEKEPLTDIVVFNLDKEAFVDDQHLLLIRWLVDERSFSETRMEKMLL